MNNLDCYSSLSNKYYFLRHGQSTANRQNIIVSKPENAINDYGLTGLGVNQVIATAQDSRLNQDAIIISSDYKRAIETAQVLASVLSVKTEVSSASELRERDFGEYELKDAQFYQQVWSSDEDKNASSNTIDGVESVASVLKRVMSLISKLEQQYQDKKIVLVSHGDVIQITLCYFQQLSPNMHRYINSVKNAELRRLKLRNNPASQATNTIHNNNQNVTGINV